MSSKENTPRIGVTRKRKEAQLLAFLIAYIVGVLLPNKRH
jgi:hypothetical protein